MTEPSSPFRLSLAWKIVLTFGLIVLAGLLAFSLLATQSAAREVRGFMFRGGMTDSAILADDLTDYYRVHGSWEGVEPLLVNPSPWHRAFGDTFGPGMMQRMTGMEGMMSPAVSLVHPDGRVIVGPGAPGAVLPSAAIRAGTPLIVDDHTVGILIVSGPSVSSLGENLIGRLARTTWIVGGAIGLAALIAGAMLLSGLLKPVRELTAATRALARGDLTRRVTVHTHDEVGELSDAFNQMAENLQRAEQLRRDMTADIAHELRNPLAVLQAQAEALADGVYPPTAENLAPVLDNTRLLSRLVEDLRTLALADSGQLTLDRVPSDLKGLAERVVQSYRGEAEQAGIQLSLRGDRVVSDVDPMRVEQILGNLLTNALRYTARGGLVEFRVGKSPAGDRAQVEVADSGDGIPAEALPFVFERFYRADRSRSRSQGGAGLGLAITRQLVEAHAGTITANNRPEGGAIFTVTLPLGAGGT
ncbi:MAG TPA: ATP-binding protein [Anaerolineales bacterium]|nr:ATP-binding protein [Anaerolineales bacterium]